RGVATHVAYLHDGANRQRLLASRAVLHRISCAGNHDPRILVALCRLAKTHKPHFIQTWLPQMDVVGALTGLGTRTPFILAERSCQSAYAGGWKNRLRRMVGMHADAIVANSEGGRAYWATQGFPGRLEVIPNGVPLDEIAVAAAPPSAAALSPAAQLIVYAGRLSWEKNIPNMLSALNTVLERQPHAVALLFGDGPLHEQVRAWCNTSWGGRAQFRGYSDELWGWLRRADVFVSLSHFEGHPNTVLEAAACACPLVISDIPAHREFLDEESAWLVPGDAPEQVATAIVEALRNRALARRRAEQARAAMASMTTATA